MFSSIELSIFEPKHGPVRTIFIFVMTIMMMIIMMVMVIIMITIIMTKIFFFLPLVLNSYDLARMLKKKIWSWWWSWWSWSWPWSSSWWSSSWWSWQKWKLSERGHVWAQTYLAQWRKTCSSARSPSRWFLLRESKGPRNGKLTKSGKYWVQKVENLFFSAFLNLLRLLIGIDINIVFLKFILPRFRDMGLQNSQIGPNAASGLDGRKIYTRTSQG